MLRLQETAGNSAVASLLASPRASPERDSGRQLDASVRKEMEARFSADFGAVRVHAGPADALAADALEANAYTVGDDITFAEGRFDPSSPGGRTLLAHELAHVVQQQRGRERGDRSAPGASAEGDARAAAHAVMQGECATVSASTGVGVAREPGTPKAKTIGRVEATVELLKRAKAHDLAGDRERAKKILETIQQFVDGLATEANMQRSFGGLNGMSMTAARMFVDGAVGAVKRLSAEYRSGPHPSLGQWERQIQFFAMGKEYLEILAGERTIEGAKTISEYERGTNIVLTVIGVATALPIVISGSVLLGSAVLVSDAGIWLLTISMEHPEAIASLTMLAIGKIIEFATTGDTELSVDDIIQIVVTFGTIRYGGSGRVRSNSGSHVDVEITVAPTPKSAAGGATQKPSVGAGNAPRVAPPPQPPAARVRVGEVGQSPPVRGGAPKMAPPNDSPLPNSDMMPASRPAAAPEADMPRPAMRASAPKPLSQPPKPAAAPPKRAVEPPKATTEAAKPTVETPKTATPTTATTAAPKAAVEAAKPTTEPAKPTAEPPEPTAEAPKTSQSAKKPVDPTEETPESDSRTNKPRRPRSKSAKGEPEAESKVDEPAAKTAREAAIKPLSAKIAENEARINVLRSEAKQLEADAAEAGNQAAANKNSNPSEWSKQIKKQQQAAARARAKLDEATRLDTENKAMRAQVKGLEILPCFSADTLVWTAAGARRIDALQSGDAILAFDFHTERVVERNVIDVFRNRTAHLYDIVTGGELIRATGAHRFFVSDSDSWIPARHLRSGMRLRGIQQDTIIETIDICEPLDVETFNLSVDATPNYFVGPGTLVHNQGEGRLPFGIGKVYDGFNPKFENKIYVGQTDRSILERQDEHRALAKKRLANPEALTPKQKEFCEFMEGVELRERVGGLKPNQADYVEQTRMDAEKDARGAQNVMNNREEVPKKDMPRLEREISTDPDVVKAGYCPKT